MADRGGNRSVLTSGGGGGGGAMDTWTPVVTFGATVATAEVEGRWYQTGPLVVASFAFRVTNLNGGTGYLAVTLPADIKLAGAAAFPAAPYSQTVGYGSVLHTGQIYHYFLTGSGGALSEAAFRSPATPSVGFTHAAPFAVTAGAAGAGDEWYGTLTYESA